MNDTQINFCWPSVFSQAVDELPQVEVPAQVQPSNDPACMNREIHVGMPFRSEYTDRIIDTAHIEHAHVPNPGLREITSHVPGFPSTWGNEKLILTSARMPPSSIDCTVADITNCVEASRGLPMQSAPSILVDTQGLSDLNASSSKNK
ncbi:hypothetical protein Tco_1087682 [Tanacetum coccineum]